MGIARSDEDRRLEMEELRRTLVLSCAGLSAKKGEEQGFRDRRNNDEIDDAQGKLVGVTSGVSHLGLALTRQLLARGFSVRLLVHNQEDMEKLREIELSGEMNVASRTVGAIMVDLTDGEGLAQALDGCAAVLHTASFIDPCGLSGYSKHMAEVEVKLNENVIRACASTPSVRRCVLTSSLLACIWKDHSPNESSSPVIIDHRCWSEESLCQDKKLWYALGKLRSEKKAWSIAKEMGLQLATICPGLIVGSEYCQRNPTSTIAYLKGSKEMYLKGLLATADLDKLAVAQVQILETMSSCGRYICFDQVIDNEDKAEKLVQETGLQTSIVSTHISSSSTNYHLSNTKLNRLMSSKLGCSSY